MDRKAWLTAVAVVGVVALAASFRFYDITHYPPGLFPDQAANGEDALLILDGDTRPFYPRGNGREALFFYLQAAFIKAFGIGVWPMFAASALVGTLTVLAMFFATRPYFGRLAGILAALFLATNHWHVTLSRTGFRAILIPLFLALVTASIGYAVRAVKKKQFTASYGYAALAGISLAGGFYTYIAYRMVVGVVLGVVLIMLLAALHPKIGFPHLKRYRRQLLIAAVAGVIVFLPLGVYFLQHPDTFVGRAGQVSVFNPDLQREFGGGKLLPTILYSLRETLTSFFAGDGDANWRHSVPGYPLLNPLVGILVLLGIAWTIHGTVIVIYHLIRGQELHLGLVYPYLLLLLGGMLVPVITTAEGIPHGLRSIGLIMPVFLLAGTAGSVGVYWIKRHVHGHGRAISWGVAAGLMVLGGMYDGSLYFLIARNDAHAYAAYRGDLTPVADYLNQSARAQAGPRPYLVLDAFSLQTIHYLTTVRAHDHVVGDATHPDEAQHKWVQLNPSTSEQTVLQPGEIIIFTQSTMADADRYARVHANIEVVESRKNRWDQEIMRLYRGTAEPAPPVGGSLDA